MPSGRRLSPDTPASIDDRKRLQDAAFVSVALWSLLLVSVAIGVLNLVNAWWATAAVLFTTAVLSAIGIWLSRRGRSSAAAVTLCVTTWFAIALSAFLGAGVYDEAVLAFPLLILAGAFVLGDSPVGIVVTTAASVVSVFVLTGLQASGLLVVPFPVSWLRPLIESILFVTTGGLVWFVHRAWQSNEAAMRRVAMQNTELFEAERNAARLASVLNEINELLLSSLTVDEMLERIVAETSQAVGADMSLVTLVEDDQLLVVNAFAFPEGTVGSRFPLASFPAVVAALDRREPTFVEDALASATANQEVAHELDVRAVMVLPLTTEGRVVGVLAYLYREPRHFEEHEVAFAGRLAVALSLALESARHFEAERDIADRLQDALLTLPESVPGIEFAHAYHSASEAARVGGDFYDLFELNHDHVGIVTGDVAGKGIDAAVLTSMVKNTIRAHATERGKTPSQILSLTNEVVYKATPTESFVTVFFGILDCRDRLLVYANAGHTTTALVHGGGSYGKLGATGPLLGAFGAVTYEEAEVRVAYGELLFLYTDGLTEARRDHELYGEERLFSFLATKRDEPPADVVRETLADVVSFSGNRLRDDVAILALRCVAPGEEHPRRQEQEVRSPR